MTLLNARIQASEAEPVLQNIPPRTALGRTMLEAFRTFPRFEQRFPQHNAHVYARLMHRCSEARFAALVCSWRERESQNRRADRFYARAEREVRKTGAAIWAVWR